MEKAIAILSLGNIDLQIHSRVLRQIYTAGANFPVDVIAYGEPKEITGLPVRSLHIVGSLLEPKVKRAFLTLFFLSIGRFFPKWGYETWYWTRPGHQKALAILNARNIDVIIANNWWSMPVASRYKDSQSVKIILDLHEYSLDEFTDRGWLKYLYQPMIEYQFRTYLKYADATIVVNESVAQRYHQEFGIQPIVVMNSPALDETTSFRPTEPQKIKLVHHGYAARERKLEWMIEILRHLDNRFTLTFVLGGDSKYIDDLKRIAEVVTPGRVSFHPFVPPLELPKTLNQFDMGIFVIPSKGYSLRTSLPNKFFEFLMGCLPVCVGSLPEMARLIEQYHCGVAIDTIDPERIASVLNNLSVEKIDTMKQAAMSARRYLNADIEQKKLLDLIQSLI
jgi:glycosyltransferase involved in cell wall biosynthesis